jgi:transposase
VAKRCHTASRKAKRDLLGVRPPDLLHPAPATALTPAPTPMAARLTDEKWERIKPLLPPQKPPTGRPRSDHRTVLAGMLWVLGTGASWRDLLEEEFGPRRTVYGRYREWREEGLWQHIVDMLRPVNDAVAS